MSKQVLAAFGALCLVLAAIGALFIFSLRTIEHRRQTQQSRAHQKWEAIDELAESVGLMQTEVLQHVLTTDVEEMERRDQTIRKLDEAIARVLTEYEIAVDNVNERRLCARFRQARTAYGERTAELLILSRANQNAEAGKEALTKQSPAYVVYQRVVNEMMDAAKEYARQSRVDTSRLIGQLGKDGGVLIGVAMLITLGTGFTVVRVARRLRNDNEALQVEITERKPAEELLRQSKERLHHLVSANPSVIYSLKFLNGELVPTWISDNIVQLTSHTPEEVLAPNWWPDRLHPDDRERVQAEHAAPFRDDRLLTEYRFQRKDGSYFWVRDEKTLSRDAAGNPVEVVGSWADITASKRAVQELNHVFTLSQDLLCIAGFDGFFKRLNPAWERLLGWTNEELLARPFMTLVHPEDAGKTTAEVKRIAAGGETLSFEIRVLCKDGSYRWVLWNASPVRGEPQFHAAGRDITERKQSEQQLRVQATALEAAANAIIVTARDGTILWANRAFTTLTGYSVEEALGRKPSLLKSGQHDEAFYRQLWKTISSGEVWSGQIINRRRDGTLYTEEMTITPVLADDGRIIRFVAVKQDVTERQRLEEILRESESHFRSLSAASPLGIFQTDATGRCVYTNERWREISGQSLEESLGRGWNQVLHPEDRERVLREWQEAASGRNEVFVEYRILGARKETRWISTRVKPTQTTDGVITGWVGTIEDISARKEAENALRRSETKFRTLYDSNSDAVMLLDEKGFFDCNRATLAMFGCATHAEFCLKHPADLSPPVQPNGEDSVTLSREHIGVAKERGSLRFEWMHQRADNGDTFITDVQLTAMELDGKHVLQAVVRDISERKQAEQALREQQQRLEVALHGANLGSWDWDVSSGEVVYSARWAEMLGYTPSEIEPHFRSWETLLHADDLPDASKRLKKHLEGLAPYYDIEVRMRHKSGAWRWVHSCGKVVARDAGGRPVRMAGTHEDITARKQNEEDLAHRAQLATLTAEVGLVLTRSDNLPDILQHCATMIVHHVDAAFARIWTLDPSEEVLKLQASAGTYTHLDGPHSRVPVGKFKIGLIAQDRKPHLTNTVVGDPRVGDQEWARREGMVAFAGYPLVVADQVVGVMALFARRPLPEDTLQKLAAIADGIAVGIVRKKSEEALRESEERFRQLAENISEVFYLSNSEITKILYISPAYERIWGRTCESLYQNPISFAGAIHPDDQPRVIAALERQRRAETVDEEFRIIQPDGSIRWIRDRSFPIRNAAGAFYRTAGLAEDITERKQTEAELEKLHKELVTVSHRAGMAEVATNVLHNVGNVLNSVNVSVDVLARKIRNSRAPNLGAVAALLREQRQDLAGFLTRDPRGQALPGYLDQLAKHLGEAQPDLLRELDGLGRNVEHIKQIVDMQQAYARHGGVIETLSLENLVEDAIRINAAGYTRHQVEIVRQFSPLEPVEVNKHKVLQILVNLLSNAKYALESRTSEPKQVRIQLALNGHQTVRIVVADNGAGIAPEILPRIFEHGFTTRKDGHGYGLHSGAIAARELGGSLTGQSDGPNRGAAFTLELPLKHSQQ